jgi:plastocyanin
MKKIIFMASLAIAIAIGIASLPMITKAESINSRLSGRILLAVQNNGETWYVNPVNMQRYFLGEPLDAITLMQQLGLGITNKDFDSYKGVAPLRLSGRILLKVEDLGKAYYINPVNLKMYFLGSSDQALKLMQSLSIGVTNSDLAQMSIPQKANVSITNSGFSPATLTINQGAMVTWTNFTNSAQTVTSPNNFNFGEFAAGKTYSRMFNVAGTFNYYSAEQTNFTGTIIVK